MKRAAGVRHPVTSLRTMVRFCTRRELLIAPGGSRSQGPPTIDILNYNIEESSHFQSGEWPIITKIHIAKKTDVDKMDFGNNIRA